MATFIYNRVLPTKQIPGEPWISPLALQYPDREAVDLTKLQSFGLTCWVHQKKQIRDLGYGGKSDKKQQARQGILVGYNDQMGPLRAKVYLKTMPKQIGMLRSYWNIVIDFMNWN